MLKMTMKNQCNLLLLITSVVSFAALAPQATAQESGLTTTEQQVNSDPSCTRALDVALIIDRSGSIFDLFPIFKQRIADLVEGFAVGPDFVRFGAVIFNETANLVFTLDEYDNINEYSSAINSIPGPGGLTNLADAFRVTRNEVLVSPGDRPTVPNVCILFTDGIATREVDSTEPEAALLRENCILIIVSYDNFTDIPLLTRIASDNRFFRVINVDLLASIHNNITETACAVNCSASLCCLNEGVATLAVSGFCECLCPPNFSGTYCEDINETATIELSTYQGGNNPYWNMELTSTDSRHPIQDILRGSNVGDSYDNFGSFNRNDDKPRFTINFRGPGENKLDYIEGQLTARTSGSNVKVKFFNEGIRVKQIKINLQNGGRYPELAYQDFRINMNGQSVTRIRFDFKRLNGRSRRGGFGINDLFAVYTKAINNTVNTDCEDTICGDAEEAHWVNGCCKCFTLLSTDSTPPPF